MHSERSVGFKRQAAKIKAVPINILNNNNMYIFVITINQNYFVFKFVLFTYVLLFFFFRSLKPRLLIMGRKKIKISKITDERNRHVRLIYYSIFNCSSFRFVLNVDV